MATNTPYYSQPTYTESGSTYYVMFDGNDNIKVTFNSYKDTLMISYDFWLSGNFMIPPYLLTLNIESSIGTISNIPLYLCGSSYNGQILHHYITSFNISLTGDKVNNMLLFMQNWDFKATFGVNNNIYNSAGLDSSFDNFIAQLSGLSIDSSICFSNYFPINKLSTFYCSKQYQNQNFIGKTLPDDYFTWEQNKSLTSTPDYYFNRVTQPVYSPWQTMFNIYQSNIGSGNLAYFFNIAVLKINYWIQGKEYNQTFNLADDSFYKDAGNCLVLNLRTIYDFNTHQLIQSNTGVKGIYFPVATSGTIDLSLMRNGKRYVDQFNFAFKDNFYSVNNSQLNVQILQIPDQNIQWSTAC